MTGSHPHDWAQAHAAQEEASGRQRAAEPREITPGQVMTTLDALSAELHTLADGLAKVERELQGKGNDGGVQDEYQRFIDDYEIGLWNQHVNDGAKLPAKDLRLQLAHKAMDPALYGRYFALVKSRDRMLTRIGTLKAEIGAQRSILSALKEGLIG